MIGVLALHPDHPVFLADYGEGSFLGCDLEDGRCLSLFTTAEKCQAFVLKVLPLPVEDFKFPCLKFVDVWNWAAGRYVWGVLDPSGDGREVVFRFPDMKDSHGPTAPPVFPAPSAY